MVAFTSFDSCFFSLLQATLSFKIHHVSEFGLIYAKVNGGSVVIEVLCSYVKAVSQTHTHRERSEKTMYQDSCREGD